MIVKYYKLYCDECGRWIDDVKTSSIDKAVRITKRTEGDDVKITKRLNGAYHIKCVHCIKADAFAKEAAKFLGGLNG